MGRSWNAEARNGWEIAAAVLAVVVGSAGVYFAENLSLVGPAENTALATL